MLEWLTPAERRGAAILVLLLLLGAVNDLWRTRRPPADRDVVVPGLANPTAAPGAAKLPGPAETHGDGRAPGARLNLNHAGVTELESLPGIGPVLAARIVAHRTAHGRFVRIEELLGVRGVGPRLFARLRPHLAVGEESGPRGARRDSARREASAAVQSAVPAGVGRADSASVGRLRSR